MFEVGERYDKKEIMAHYRDFEEIDFQEAPVLTVVTKQDKTTLEFVKERDKFRLRWMGKQE